MIFISGRLSPSRFIFKANFFMLTNASVMSDVQFVLVLPMFKNYYIMGKGEGLI